METTIVCDILKNEFIKRCQKNSKYSIRAYAKYLDVDHSLLSKIIRGQHKLSKKMAYKVGEKLGLTISQINECIQEQSEKSKSQQISEDIFIVMSDWYHFAILELIKTQEFTADLEQIANSLDISTLEAKVAMERLMRLGFIKQGEGGVYLERINNQWFDHKKSNESRRILQKQLLQKAIAAVDDVSFDKRINSSLTIAIDNKELPRFREIAQGFIDNSDQFSEIHKKKQVYQLCVAFYPLSKEK